MDKDMVNVGVRRQSCSPPNIAMSSLIQRGSSQVRAAALPALLVFAGQQWQHWRLAGKAAAPPMLPGF